MTISKKTRLLPPPFIGTKIKIRVPEDYQFFGLRSTTLAPGCETVTVEWGDGTSDTQEGFSRFQHEYAHPGEYEVLISDELSQFALSTSNTGSAFHTHIAPMVLSVLSNAKNLHALYDDCFFHCINMAGCAFNGVQLTTFAKSPFAECASLAGSLALPFAESIEGDKENLPFAGCMGLTEIHFAQAKKEMLLACPAFEDYESTRLGAENATVYFDL